MAGVIYGGDGLDLLSRALGALEAGNWRAALRFRGEPGVVSPYLQSGIRLVATSMLHRAIGEVNAAWLFLVQATGTLPSALIMRDRDAGIRVALLPAPDPARQYTWRLARTIWREQAEIKGLRDHPYQPDEQSARPFLIEAMIEEMSWVEFDRWTWSDPAFDPGIGELLAPGVEAPTHFGLPGRADILRRATNLRRLGNPVSKPVSTSVWMDAGGIRGCKRHAFWVLAHRPLRPWANGTDLAVDIPVRQGFEYAWKHALSWKETHGGSAPH